MCLGTIDFRNLSYYVFQSIARKVCTQAFPVKVSYYDLPTAIPEMYLNRGVRCFTASAGGPQKGDERAYIHGYSLNDIFL